MNVEVWGDAVNGQSPMFTVGVSSTKVSVTIPVVSYELPVAVDKGQLYYWSYKWQQGEQIVRNELEQGLGRTFDNPKDAIRWLLSEE